jgi:hypothetical protein
VYECVADRADEFSASQRTFQNHSAIRTGAGRIVFRDLFNGYPILSGFVGHTAYELPVRPLRDLLVGLASKIYSVLDDAHITHGKDRYAVSHRRAAGSRLSWRPGQGGTNGVPLPQPILIMLRQYWLTHRDPIWLFPSPFQPACPGGLGQGERSHGSQPVRELWVQGHTFQLVANTQPHQVVVCKLQTGHACGNSRS